MKQLKTLTAICPGNLISIIVYVSNNRDLRVICTVSVCQSFPANNVAGQVWHNSAIFFLFSLSRHYRRSGAFCGFCFSVWQREIIFWEYLLYYVHSSLALIFFHFQRENEPWTKFAKQPHLRNIFSAWLFFQEIFLSLRWKLPLFVKSEWTSNWSHSRQGLGKVRFPFFRTWH